MALEPGVEHEAKVSSPSARLLRATRQIGRELAVIPIQLQLQVTAANGNRKVGRLPLRRQSKRRKDPPRGAWP